MAGAGSLITTFPTSSVDRIVFVGGDGDDYFRVDVALPTVAHLHSGADTFIGGAGDDVVYGGDGDDILVGNDGADRLFGENGRDRLVGGGGRDYLLGNAGDDHLHGGDDGDELFGGPGNDFLDGDAGDDLLYGDGGHDTILGNAGNDRLFGRGGDDSLHGGDGDDQLHGEGDNDSLYGDGGNDLLVGSVGDDILYGGDGADDLQGGLGDDQLHGGNGDDRLIGDDGNDLLAGNWGNDLLYGRNGDDTLLGGVGDDVLEGEAGHDLLRGDTGNDLLIGSVGDDRLYGGDGRDELHGGVGNDQLHGENDDDIIIGDDGDDLLVGNGGDDSLYGRDGDDTLFGGAGNDWLEGENGHDLLYGNRGNDLLVGSIGDDRLYGGDGSDQLFGGLGNDQLHGGNGDDQLIGDDGNDLLAGNWGNDSLYGRDGDDTLFGGVGDDLLEGENGNDQIRGDSGNDLLVGSIGDDQLYGGDGDDQLFGGLGNDLLSGEGGNDDLRGDDEHDILLGGLGKDKLLGGAGDDLLAGNDGDDALMGEWGDDVLIGGMGADQLWGGADNDLLLGGLTPLEYNLEFLTGLVGAWRSGADYAASVSAARAALFADPEAFNMLTFDDGVADELIGNAGRDWFFRTGVLQTYDPLGRGYNTIAIADSLPALEGFALIDSFDYMRDKSDEEILESQIHHSGDSLKQSEHLALTELVRYDQVSHYATRDGDWSDPTVWSNRVVPNDGARVLVPIGVTLRVDAVIDQRIDTVRVDGSLVFATEVNTELVVDTMVVTAGGSIEIGSELRPVQAGVTARLTFSGDAPLDPDSDPHLIGRGLISHGRASFHGQPVQGAGVAALAYAGGRHLVFETVPAGWKVGDHVAIAPAVLGAKEGEERVITGINSGRVILDRPLEYNHTASAGATVVNLTRNVVISSESADLNRRGHVMFMHNKNVSVANTEFFRLGRTNKLTPINDPIVDAEWNLVDGSGANPRARYPVHFHRNGTRHDGAPAVVSGSSVHDAPGWGYVNHSSYVDFTDNVAYAVGGAAFAAEVGDEIGSFVGNTAIATYGSGEVTESRLGIQDFGHQGDGFWFQGVGVRVVGNVSIGNDGSAFAFYARSLPDGGINREFLAANLADPSIAAGEETIAVGDMPVREFSQNYGAASSTGLLVQYHLELATHSKRGVFSDSVFVNNRTGIDLPYSNQVVLENLIVSREVDEPLESRPWYGITGNGIARNIIYKNLQVAGYYFGIDAPRTGESVISGGRYENWVNIYVRPGKEANRSLLVTGDIKFSGWREVSLVSDFRPFGMSTSFIFTPDAITLDYGAFNRQQVFFVEQGPTAVPFPEPLPYVSDEYVGLTAAELWARHGLAVGGRLAPLSTVSVPSVLGLIEII